MASKIPSGRFLNDGEKRDLAHTHGIQARSHTVTKPGVHGESNPRLHEIKAPVK